MVGPHSWVMIARNTTSATASTPNTTARLIRLRELFRRHRVRKARHPRRWEERFFSLWTGAATAGFPPRWRGAPSEKS